MCLYRLFIPSFVITRACQRSVFVGFGCWFDVRCREGVNCLRTLDHRGVMLNLDSLILRKTIGWGCQGTGCWGTYLNLDRKSNSKLEKMTQWGASWFVLLTKYY
jgi:hypothetical protein